jgi:poly-gamma-glutamate synthesis protein (capsule biosynthesis protein)
MSLEEAAALAEPLEAIRLPRRVLAYGGLYPGDPGYRLVRTVSVTVEPIPATASRATRRRLQAVALEYLKSFPEPRQPVGLNWLGAVGDVMPGQGTSKLLLQPDGPARVFRRLLPVMQAQDILVANLETAVTDRGTEWPKTFRFRMPASALEPLLDSGIDVVSLANNHVYDYTEVGFADTVAALKTAGLPFVGAGLNWDEAVVPYETAAGAARVAVWALGAFPVERTGFYGLKHASVQRGQPGLLWADAAAVQAVGDALAARRGNGQLLIVSVHAGLEYTYGPYEVQTSLYRKLIDLGADVILGHHPHVLQPMEWYDGPERSGLIVYSLGNFVFDNIEDNPKGLETMLLSLGISGGAIRALRIYPARMDGYAVDIADDGAPRALVRSLSTAWAGDGAAAHR